MKPIPAQLGRDTEQGEQAVLGDVFDMERREVQKRGVPERGTADDARGHTGEDDGAEGLDGEVPQDELHREEHPGQRGVEGRGDTAGRTAGHQQPHPPLGDLGRSRPSVEPSAEPICTIGPSRPTDPPDPMVSAEASDLTTATLALIRPPRWATASITSGTPWPRASLANRSTSGPYSSPPTTGASSTKNGPSQDTCGFAACPAPE